MVMEAPPSPQSVGREFVRQYYTLLNKAPTHLHRFYNHQSSFVHGGLDPPNRETSPVIGQKQIHQKIQQLNFRDCHAKITQVDSQATLGNGVVVQVTGELSNAGQPMRRFTQTFVLAAQSPKKYYVHNDIFRYQDEIISDEECDGDNHSEPEEEVTPERHVLAEVQQQISQQPVVPQYYNPNTPPIQPMPQVAHHHSQPPPHAMTPQPPAPTVNGAVHPEEMNVLQGQIPAHVPGVQNIGMGAALPPVQPAMVQTPINQPTPMEDVPPVLDEPDEEQMEPSYGDVPEVDEEPDLNEPASSEPKTYANLLKSGNTIPYSSPPHSSSVPMVQPMGSASPEYQPERQNTNQALGPRGSQNSNRGPPRINQQQQQSQPQRLPRQDSNRGPGRNSMNEDGSVFFSDPDRMRLRPNLGDVNQLFLGNLPHTATEDELRDIFIEFGAILDLRVHSKPTNKGGPPGARAPPNYGFITYESQQGVQCCLQAKPIYYPKGDINGVQLNVEEKKTKDRPSFGGRPSSDNRGPRDNGGQRRGMGGPGGPNRNSTGGPGLGGPNNRNNYNRSGGPPNRGPSTYNRR